MFSLVAACRLGPRFSLKTKVSIFFLANTEKFKRDPLVHENIQYNAFTFPGEFVYLYHSLKTQFYTNGEKIGIDNIKAIGIVIKRYNQFNHTGLLTLFI